MFEINSVKIPVHELVCLDTKIMSISELEAKILDKSVFGRPFWKMAAIEARGQICDGRNLKSFPHGFFLLCARFHAFITY